MRCVTNQAEMEAALAEFCRHIREDYPGTVNAGLAPQFVCCDFSADRYTIAFPCGDWMSNPGGVTHGGVTAAMLDTAMGGITYVCAGNRPTPTVSMQVSYVRPIPLDSTVYVDVQLTGAGRTLSNVTAAMYPADHPEQVLATAAGTYFSRV